VGAIKIVLAVCLATLFGRLAAEKLMGGQDSKAFNLFVNRFQ
jgi:hypothetical protein